MKTKSFWQSLLSLFVASALLLGSCTDLTDVENSIKDLQEDVAELQTQVTTLDEALNSLRTAYESGKTIQSVEPVTSSEMEGWKITFTDGQSITIMSEYKPEALPDTGLAIESIEQDPETNVVTIVLKDGRTFEFNPETPGVVIESIEQDPETGVVTITLDNGSTFQLNEYPGVIISSIEQDPMTGIVTIELADGTSFEFGLEVNYPTSIVLLNDSLVFGKEATATFEFRVNPSNATINYNLEGENPQIKLDLLATRANAESYVNEPLNYKLTSITPSLNEKGEVKVGQYTATVTDLEQSTKYDEKVALVIQSRDNNGNAIEITSSTTMNVYMKQATPEFTSFAINATNGTISDGKVTVLLPYTTNLSNLAVTFEANGAKVYVGDVEQTSGVTRNNFSEPVTYRVVLPSGEEKTYQVAACFSNLPTTYVWTNGTPIRDKENWIAGSRMTIVNAGELDAVYENMNIRGRGNSTWNLPKKPYAIKLDKKAEVLGMKKHKRWCLLANYLDRTLIRNAVSFEIARKMPGLAYTPSGDFVDLVLNGEYQGCYYLCEQIKIDENRVNIAELETTDTSEPNVTGGYLLELDTNYDEVNKWYSNFGWNTNGRAGMPVMIKEPDEEVILPGSAQLNYIKNYYNNVESLIYNHNFSSYPNYMDMDSYIDYWLVYEITGNREPNHPKSVYMHKDRNGKLFAGPVWDFDWGTFSPTADGGGYPNNLLNNSAVWYGELFQDPAFVARVKERWAAIKPILESSIPNYINEQANKVKASDEANITLWPITEKRPNGDEDMSFNQAVTRLKKGFTDRMTAMDQLINNLK